MKEDTAAILELIREVKIDGLMKGTGGVRYEASGVCEKDGFLHIVFDDSPRLLYIRPDWVTSGEEPQLLELKGPRGGYEDITYQPSAGRWYCLVEAAEREPGTWIPRVDEFDESFAFVGSHWLNFPLKAGNKGFEGLSALRHGGNDYLLGLCEGNNCKGGREGAEPGKGRVQVFKQAGKDWEHTGTVRLPKAVRFRDYSSLDIRNGFMVVISQASSAIWVSHLHTQPAGPEDLFEDEGRLFLFPRDEKGCIMYCNPEGVAWLGDDLLAVVSDRKKSNQPGRCASRDQSVHIFRLPAPALPGD